MSDIYTPTDHQVPIRVGALDPSRGPQIQVNEPAILAIRQDAWEQSDHWLSEVTEAWPETDISDLDAIQDLASKLSMALAAVSVLVELAPTPAEEDPEA